MILRPLLELAAILAFFADDTPIETWLSNSRFGEDGDRIVGRGLSGRHLRIGLALSGGGARAPPRAAA